MRLRFRPGQLLAFAVFFLASSLQAEEEPFRPTPGTFPPADQAVAYRGELVFVDHVNRRGSLRLQVDGHYHEGKLHHFAMLPYGEVWFRGAPADLRDIPIGTVMYGRFYLPPDPKISAVPNLNPKTKDVTAPPENHAILLEDGPSFCLREDKAWKLKEVGMNGPEGHLIATLDRKEGGEGLGGEHKFTIDGSTRVWRGLELLTIAQLVDEGTWPAKGQRDLEGKAVQLALGWHARYLYQQFHVSDIWLDKTAMKQAAHRQHARHIRQIRTRWMPAYVDHVEHGQFGQATVTITLFGGMAPALYDGFKAGNGGKMAAAENTLRTWWPDHDGMDGKIVAVEKVTDTPPLGSSGIELKFEVPLVLEGFRPGQVVRIRPHNWPNVKPPIEERVRSFEERWPSPDIFKR